MPKTYRQLVRIYSKGRNNYTAIVPGWCPTREVRIPHEDVPFVVKSFPYRCYAHVNLDARTSSDLVFSKWEKQKKQ